MAVIAFVLVVQIFLIYYGGELFRTSGLNTMEFIIMITIAITVIPIDLLRKLYLKITKKNINI